MLSKEEVLHIAKLARLELTQQETLKMQKDLSAILDYIKLLKKADTSKAKDAKQTLEIEMASRKDKAEVKPASLANNLVKTAPNTQDDYIKVKNIF